MEYRRIEFIVELLPHGDLKVVAVGEMPNPLLTQAELDLIVEQLNDHAPVIAGEALATQRMTPFEVKPTMVAAAMRDLQATPEEPEE